MIKSIRRTAPAILAAAALCLSIFQYCAVDDEGGAIVGSGPTNPGGGNPTIPSTGGGGGGSGVGTTTPTPEIQFVGGSSQNETPSAKISVRTRGTAPIPVKLVPDTAGGSVRNGLDSISVWHTGKGYLVDSTGDKGRISNPGNVKMTIRNGNGSAIVSYVATDTVELVDVFFEYTNASGNKALIIVTVEVTEFSKRNLKIVDVSPSVIDADGISTSTITAQVYNKNGNPFVGELVGFAVSPFGIVTTDNVTDAYGKATATLMSEKRNETVRVKAYLKNSECTDSCDASVEVEFKGVTIQVSASRNSIVPGDTNAVTAALRDAANKPIIGENVIFTAKDEFGNMVLVTEDKLWTDTVATDVNGSARVSIDKIIDIGPKNIKIIARAAGASDSTKLISVSNSEIHISENEDNSYCVGGTSEFYIRITDTNNNDIYSTDLMVTVTIGLMMFPDTIFAQKLNTGLDGYCVLRINNPTFSDSGYIYAKTNTANSYAPYIEHWYPISFKSCSVDTIEVAVTSAVIDVLEDPNAKNKINSQTEVIATVYDVYRNRVSGVNISFNLIKGPGGGTTFNPQIATTGRDGRARTILTAGAIPSTFQGVEVMASNYYPNGDPAKFKTSNIAKLTIAGPPHRINVGWALGNPDEAGAAAYSLGVSALVSDVNGNPVRNRQVTFSAIVNGWSTEVMGNGYNIPGCINKPDPGSAAIRAAVTIQKSVNTDENGVAVNALIYSQSYAARINVILWVESGGLVTYSESLDVPVPDRIRESGSWSACQVFDGTMLPKPDSTGQGGQTPPSALNK